MKPEPKQKAMEAIQSCWKEIGTWGNRSCSQLETQIHCRNCPIYSAAAVRLLDRELPANHFEEWTPHVGKSKVDKELDTQSSVIFRAGAEWLALPTDQLFEIAELKTIHSLPHRRNPAVLGLVNVRGELLICISLVEALGLEKVSATPESLRRKTYQRLMVVGSNEQNRLVFSVDEIFGTHRHSSREVETAPSTVAKAASTHIVGTLRWQEKSVGLLNAEQLFSTLNQSLR